MNTRYYLKKEPAKLPGRGFKFSLCLLLILSSLISACGGGGSNGDDENSNKISRIEITPGTALLTDLGQTRQLEAVAYNAEGDVVAADFIWESGNSDLMSVNSQGLVTSLNYSGSTVVSASADGVSGNATLLAVALLPNSVLVNDNQVLDTPQLIDPNTVPTVGSQYRVTLSTSVEVTIGDILLASETAPVGGRVVEVNETNGSKQVTLEMIPLNQMFSKLKIDQTYHLTQKNVEVPSAVSEAYDISENSDGSLNFTPKTANQSRLQTAQRGEFAIGVPVGTVADPESLFDCKQELTPPTLPLPLTLNTLPVSNGLTIDLDLIVNYDSEGNGLQKLALGGQAKLEMKVTPTLNIAAEGKVSCEMELVTFTIPIGGPIAVLLGGQIPLGLGFEIGGKLTLAQIGAEANVKAQLDAEIGVQYNQTSSEWEMINRSNSSADAEYKWVVPDTSNFDAQFRLEPTVKGFLFADLELGNRFFSSLRFETFKMSVGPIESAKLSTVNGQVADNGFASEYKMSLNFNGKLGAEAGSLFNFLDINVSAFDLFNIDLELFKSPAMTSAQASVDSFSAGDLIEFTVELKRDSLEYFSFTSLEPYNIDEVIIYRKINTNGAITTQEIARTSASLGQSRFDLSWVADDNGSISSDFYVFVDTKALDIPFTSGLGVPYLDELELGKVTPAESNLLVEHDDLESKNHLKVVINANGEAIAVWQQYIFGENYSVWANRYTTSTGWGNAVRIQHQDASSTSRPQIDMNASGEAIAVWSQDDATGKNVWANRYVPGSGWGEAEILATFSTGLVHVELTLDASGNAIAVWKQLDGTSYNLWAIRYTSNVGWGTAQMIESNAGSVLGYFVGSETSGDMLVVWSQLDDAYDFHDPHFNIWAKRYIHVTGWGPASLIKSFPAGYIAISDFDVDVSGDTVIVGSYINLNQTEEYAWSIHYNPDTGWGDTMQITTKNVSPKIGLDANGNAIAVWHQFVEERTNANIWSSHYTTTGGWEVPELIEIYSGNSFAPVMDIDTSGKAMAMWVQDDGSIGSNSYTPGLGWDVAKQIAKEDHYYTQPEISLNAQGNVMAVWLELDADGGGNVWSRYQKTP